MRRTGRWCSNSSRSDEVCRRRKCRSPRGSRHPHRHGVEDALGERQAIAVQTAVVEDPALRAAQMRWRDFTLAPATPVQSPDAFIGVL